MSKNKDTKLTQKQEKFALRYFECGNASEAYRHAYSTGKMSENAIAVEAHRVLKSPNVSLRIKELKAEAEKESKWNVQKLIEKHTKMFEIASGEKEAPRIVVEGTGKGYTEAREYNMRQVDLASARGHLIEIGKLIGAYDKDNSQKAGIDLGALVERVYRENGGK